MNIKKKITIEAGKGEKGVVLVIIALMMTVLLGFVALAIDVGHLMVTRNELQNVADAAALAGAGLAGAGSLGNKDLNAESDLRDRIVAVVQEVAQKNKASRVNILIRDEDVKWPAPSDFNYAVKVRARRDDTANSPISTFFAGIFGNDFKTMSVTAEATASFIESEYSAKLVRVKD